MRFPQTFIDDLRRQADIVRVVGDYVSLKKKGSNWMACCPFHKEKTPSFSVNPSKEIFYCFGCSKGGSVFNFVMELERVSFPEAVRIVAEKAGVALPVMEQNQKFEARRQDADSVIQLNSWALEWWETQLGEDNPEARAARDYLEGRQIADETRRAFRLGYAPNSWDALTSHLRRKGASASDVERSGLVVKKDAGGSYDRFRGRVIFPVLDAQGRPVAFGARAIRPEDEPKYLNSPETPAYTKGRHLFGLNLSRDEIRRKGFAILVEGYLDLIVPYQFGVRNVVASLGTALTPEQAKLLKRFARQVVVNYDGDRAGIKAAKRAVETLLAEDFEVKVLVLPEGADPDEFLRAEGAEGYNRRRGAALPHMQFVLAQALRERNMHNPKEKAEAVDEALPFVRAVRHPVQKREYFDMVMDALGIDQNLRRELEKAVLTARPAADQEQDVKRIVASRTEQPLDAERELLELLIHDAELRRELLPRVPREEYEMWPTAAVFRALDEIDRAGLSVGYETLQQHTAGDAVADNLLPLLLMSEPQRAEGEATDDVLFKAESCLSSLRLIGVERRLRAVVAEIKEAEAAGDDQRLARLFDENLKLANQMQAILSKAARTGST
jgi:DNA primase